MPKPVTAELIRAQAEALQELELSDRRCAELAQEVDRYNQIVRQAAAELEFDDEPARFPALLRSLGDEPKA